MSRCQRLFWCLESRVCGLGCEANHFQRHCQSPVQLTHAARLGVKGPYTQSFGCFCSVGIHAATVCDKPQSRYLAEVVACLVSDCRDRRRWLELVNLDCLTLLLHAEGEQTIRSDSVLSERVVVCLLDVEELGNQHLHLVGDLLLLLGGEGVQSFLFILGELVNK